MWLFIFGLLFLVTGSFLHSYCAIGVQALPSLRPMVFGSLTGRLLQIGWVIMFLIASGLLLVVNWVLGSISIILYWFVLPLLTMPIMKKHMLPPWKYVKDILEKSGYTEDDYLSGDWWKELAYKNHFQRPVKPKNEQKQ